MENYDQVGTLPAGYVLVYNDTDELEAMISPRDERCGDDDD